MAKLATARDFRTYGFRRSRNWWEYANAGIYLFATVLFVFGVTTLHSQNDTNYFSGLVVILIALFLITVVNAHDLIAHLGSVDFCLSLVEFDPQLALVEFAVPLFLILGFVLSIVAIMLLLLQMEKWYSRRLERHAANLLIAGPAFWLLGSVHNICQVYERLVGHLQILQKSVQIPFLAGSLLFFVGGIFNRREVIGEIRQSHRLIGNRWVWFSTFGSILFLVGGLMNVVKVFKMQQIDGARLEKLRGGALERLIVGREGRVPLILEGSRRRRAPEERTPAPIPVPQDAPTDIGINVATATPYKDVLIGGGRD
ncbi:hypothetical protein HPP92_004857 [Vanilla planifolia]|uniref:Uncharacterized protein n=1 Tax=Vanilla planifolia TaxID=51239 RepID=A0A835RXK8_VANPL|nr:hypothetical protein HPP92_004857 [Vanilla planifolia]